VALFAIQLTTNLNTVNALNSSCKSLITNRLHEKATNALSTVLSVAEQSATGQSPVSILESSTSK
jgi:hypothetical protein